MFNTLVKKLKKALKLSTLSFESLLQLSRTASITSNLHRIELVVYRVYTSVDVDAFQIEDTSRFFD